MKQVICCLWALAIPAMTTAAEVPAGADPRDPLLNLGCLDVTKTPYLADPTGTADSTEAIQRAVNEARDHRLVCFFPEGTYLISDTISCSSLLSFGYNSLTLIHPSLTLPLFYILAPFPISTPSL